MDVVLRVAQVAQHRQTQTGDELLQLVGRDGARIHPHAHDADLELVGVAEPGDFVEKGARGVDVEDAGLQRHQHLVGHAHHVLEAPAVQAGGGVQHHVGCVARGARDQVVGHLPGADGARGRRAQLQPQARRLLAVRVSEHDGMALGGEVPRHMGGQGGLPHTPLGIRNHHDRHTDLLVV
ncbi:hypothetical protein FQZ97_1083380 [compost metagenome]